MARASRAKGLAGEREVVAHWQAAGFDVQQQQRNRDGECDQLIMATAGGLTLANETKRAERWKVNEWWPQTVANAPQGTVPTLAMRRNRGEWLVLLRLDDLTALLAAR